MPKCGAGWGLSPSLAPSAPYTAFLPDSWDSFSASCPSGSLRKSSSASHTLPSVQLPQGLPSSEITPRHFPPGIQLKDFGPGGEGSRGGGIWVFLRWSNPFQEGTWCCCSQAHVRRRESETWDGGLEADRGDEIQVRNE